MRGGEGAFEEVKGGDKQVSIAQSTLGERDWMMLKSFYGCKQNFLIFSSTK